MLNTFKMFRQYLTAMMIAGMRRNRRFTHSRQRFFCLLCTILVCLQDKFLHKQLIGIKFFAAAPIKTFYQAFQLMLLITDCCLEILYKGFKFLDSVL